MTLEFTDAAVSDLQSIRNYTLEKWGERQEEIYLDAMWDRFEEILIEPERWRFREGLFPGCQLAAQGKHVILFRVRGKTLQIVRILHSAMDYRQHIPPEVAE
jgi:toxin ParE1/3/4